MYIIQNTAEHIAANKVDSNMGATVNALIKKYEKENNITVTKFAYTYDEKPSQFAPNIKHMQSMTERKFGCEWSILYAMNYYCGRKFKKVQFEWPEEMISEPNSSFKFLHTDYNCFLEEQIFFRGDTVYMIVY